MALGRAGRLGVLACVLAVPATFMPATAGAGAAPSARSAKATVSVLHAIPAGFGADVVDVYADSTLLVDDLRPGMLTTLTLPGGTYNLTVRPDGTSPSSAVSPLTGTRTRVEPGANVTVAAHLTVGGRPVITVFTNDTSTVGRGKGRLTVRHVAAAPPVDVRTAGSTLFTGLRNARQANAGLNAGTYRVDAVMAGTRKGVLPPATVTIRNSPGTQDMGTNTILYIWGATADGALKHVVQNVRIDLR